MPLNPRYIIWPKDAQWFYPDQNKLLKVEKGVVYEHMNYHNNPHWVVSHVPLDKVNEKWCYPNQEQDRKMEHLTAELLLDLGILSQQPRVSKKGLQYIVSRFMENRARIMGHAEFSEKTRVSIPKTEVFPRTRQGTIVTVRFDGGWCRATGNRIPPGNPVYYINLDTKDQSCYSFSQKAIRHIRKCS